MCFFCSCSVRCVSMVMFGHGGDAGWGVGGCVGVFDQSRQNKTKNKKSAIEDFSVGISLLSWIPSLTKVPGFPIVDYRAYMFCMKDCSNEVLFLFFILFFVLYTTTMTPHIAHTSTTVTKMKKN